MKMNMGKTDRIIRAIAALVLLILALRTSPWLNYLFYAFAGIMALTSIVAVCPLYVPLGINTTHRPKKARRK
jgi:hypothetical protein